MRVTVKTDVSRPAHLILSMGESSPTWRNSTSRNLPNTELGEGGGGGGEAAEDGCTL